MIELITGTPGAGKTTFTVATRLAVEIGRQVTLDDDTCLKLGQDLGTVVQRRMVVAGVRGLKIEHERLPHLLTRDSTPSAEVAKWNAIQPGTDDEPSHQRLPGDPALEVPAIMQNWWLWCKPGDLIVIDEAQFVMPRASLGRKPPYWLQAMEIHRHYGVDFLIITQHPQLIDTTVRALVGMHRHIRSVMGSPVCMVYVWDHASNPERYQNANKTTFVRRAKHYRLFHSSAAHVKPPTTGRWGVIVAPLLLIAGLVGIGYRVTHLGTSQASPAAASASAVSGQTSVSTGSKKSLVGDPSASVRPPGWGDVPVLQGCYAIGDRCSCIGDRGQPVRVALAMCKLSSSSFDGLVQWAPRKDNGASPGAYGAAAASGGAASTVGSSARSPVPFL